MELVTLAFDASEAVTVYVPAVLVSDVKSAPSMKPDASDVSDAVPTCTLPGFVFTTKFTAVLPTALPTASTVFSFGGDASATPATLLKLVGVAGTRINCDAGACEIAMFDEVTPVMPVPDA